MKRLSGIKLEHIAACLAVHSLRDIPQLNRDAVLWAAKNGQSSSVAAARSGIHYKMVSRAAKKSARNTPDNDASVFRYRTRSNNYAWQHKRSKRNT